MTTLIVEIYKDADHWRMSAFYRSESMGHKQYSVQKVSETHVNELCFDVFNILSRADRLGRVTPDSLEELRKSANLLYDQALSNEVKNEIRHTEATHLVFYIDEKLVHIPWELLHDGTDYLSLRFAIGRVVVTSQKIHSEGSRHIQPKLNMLAICDPTGNLKKAYDEGLVIRKELDRARDKIRLELRTTDVNLKYAMKNIREYDIFHFAGHAKYDQQDPSKSGLILKDGDFTAGEIMTLSGSTSMPLLVFANACSSGETEGWRIEPEQQNRIYGLANTFLLTGVKYYIGTFWKIQDELSMHFARIFYKNIRIGKSIGEALRLARLQSVERFGHTALIWASYMLYGDPGDHIIAVGEKPGLRKFLTPKNVIVGSILLILAIVGAVYGFMKLQEERPLPSLDITPLKNVFYIERDGSVKEYQVLNIYTRNTARGKRMQASSFEKEENAAEYACDNDLSTKWVSDPSDPQWIYVDLERIILIGQIRLVWDTPARSYDIQVSDVGKEWKRIWRTSYGGGEVDVIDLCGRRVFTRYVRVYCRKRTGEKSYSISEFEVYPDVLPNVALKKEAFASSDSREYDAILAIDGDMGTRWGSDYEDPQWIYVDLGRRYTVDMIVIDWETAYGSSYIIQRSDDAKNWIDACTIINNKKRKNTIYFEIPLVSRYIRVYGLERGTEWGYSIWELEIHGVKQPIRPNIIRYN